MDQLKIGAILSYLAVGLNNVVGLLYTPIMLRMMGQNEYGLYSLVASVVSYLTVLDLGFGNAIIRYIAKFRAENKLQEQYEMLGMFLLFYIAIGIIAFIMGLFIYWNVDFLFSESLSVEEIGKVRIMMLLMCFNLAFTFPMSIWGSVITAYENFIFLKSVNIIRVVLNPVVMIIILWLGYRSIGMVVVTTLFNVATLSINCWYCLTKLKMKISFGKFHWGFFREVSIYSLWIFLDTIVSRFYSSIGQFLVGMYRGTVSVAVYALAVQLKSLFSSFALSLNALLLPRITHMIVKHCDMRVVNDYFRRIGRLQFLLMSYILVGFIIYGKSFISLWGGEEYVDTYYIALFLIIPFFFDLISNIGVLVLQANNQLKYRSLLVFCGSMIGFLVSIPATKKWGVWGCASVTGIAIFLFNVVASNIIFLKVAKIDIKPFWKDVLKLLVFPIGVISVFLCLINTWVCIDSFTVLILNIICFSVIYLPLFLLISTNKYERTLLYSFWKRIFMILRFG